MARNSFRKSIASATPRQRRRALWGMEMLEDRRVMATFTVANGLDSGAGSLRAAVALANADPAPDTIVFAPSVTAVTLTSAQLTLSTDMAIKGPTGGTVTVARSSLLGTPQFRILETAVGTNVELAHLTITGGSVGGVGGGGIYARGGLTLTSSTVSGNSANGDGLGAAGDGGGVYAEGSATVTNCVISGNTSADDGGGIFLAGFSSYVGFSTISNNTSQSAGGGISANSQFATLVVESSTIADNTSSFGNGGGIYIESLLSAIVASSTISGNAAQGGGGIEASQTNLTVTQSTFSGNMAVVAGGGILLGSARSTVSASTFSGNSAAQGGGINAGSPNMTLTNTIVANSLAGGDLALFGEGTFNGLGNLIEDGSGGASLGKVSGDPNLGPLANNGGPTLTHALLPGSPAIDGGAHVFQVNRLLEDQRGAPRPIGAFDIGAVESGGTSVGLVVTSAGDVTNPSDGLTTLREAVELANSNPDANAITFASGIQTVTLTQGTLGLASLVTISGPVGGTVTVTRDPAAPDFGIFSVPFGGTAQLANLTVTGARGASAISNYGGLRVTASTIANNTGAAVGGGIYNDGTLIVDASTLSGNSAGTGGGIASGYFETTAIAKVVNSTLSGNTAAGTGGGILNANTEGTFTVLSSTIAGNSAADGGGIYAEIFTVKMTLNNTIVAGGDLGSAVADRFTGSGNLVEDGSGGASLGKISGDPKLGPLASNGGPTKTHSLLSGSPAINAGINSLAAGIATDQRGLNRLVGTVDIGSVEMQPASRVTGIQSDPLNPGQNALFVYGTAGHDVIAVDHYGTSRYRVTMLSLVPGSWWPSLSSDTFQGPVSRVVVYGGDGNDGIVVDNDLYASAWLYGENGNDVLVGGGGNDLLLGGSGNDVLTARGGRDILIGGTGADDLFAGSGGDLLIAGSTAFDLDEADLFSIHREWNSSRDFTTRVKNLRGTGTGPRLNGNNFLTVSGPTATVVSDSAHDDLFGGSGRDWFFANRTGGGVKDDVFGQSNDVIEELR